MSQSVIYTVNSSAQNVAVNGTINLGTVVRKFGPNLNLSGNAVQVAGNGYYKITTSITLAPSAVGNVTVTAYKDSVAIPGAVATEAITAANNPANLSIIAVFREPCSCCEGISNITYVLTGTAASVTNIASVVEKL